MSSRFTFFLTVVLGVVFPARAAFARDAPIIAPTRLDFDASQAPKLCNDDLTFRTILGNWIRPDVFSAQANRQLVVRIRRLSTGEELADVTLVDAAGATLGEHHLPFGVKTECHRVLYETADAAANLLGAFDKPPPPAPCPTCLACPTCPVLTTAAPVLPALPTLPIPHIMLPAPPLRRAYFGLGVSFGTGMTPEGAVGPYGTLGFVLSPHMRRIQFELAGGWTPQTLPKSNTAKALHVDRVPLVGSLCYSRYVFRICSGLATTFFAAERTNLVPGNDQFRMTLAADLQMGTEFEIAGPLSIRVDVFTRLQFWQRTYGNELARLDALNVFAAGANAMAVWSFE